MGVVDGLLRRRKRSVVGGLLLEASLLRLDAGLLLLGRHVHALLLGVVALGDGTLGEAGLDFLLLLDEGTAAAPVAGAAISHAAALDAKLLSDLTTLHHGVAIAKSVRGAEKNGNQLGVFVCLHPTAASDALDAAEDHTIAVAGVGRLHGRVSHAVGRVAEHCGSQLIFAECINREHLQIQGRKVPSKQVSQGPQLQRPLDHSWFWTLGPWENC